MKLTQKHNIKSADVVKELNKFSSKEKAKISSSFFKTAKGQYGEGDMFIGVTVPDTRKVSKKFIDISFSEVEKLLKDKIHEHRLVGLFILVEKYKSNPEEVFNFYLKNIKYVNNWDLVDTSAYKIIGEYLLDKKRDILYELADSNNLWKERISIISCYRFIKNGDFKDIIKLSEKFLNHKHDLMHKAVGWMLREVGKKDEMVLKKFLNKFYKKMPRTMLRYAIEKFPENERKQYLSYGG